MMMMDVTGGNLLGVGRIYQRRIYLKVNPPLVYSSGFGQYHHHVGDDGFVVGDYDCDCNVDDDDDLGVTMVYKDTKRNMILSVILKRLGNIYLNFLNDFVKDFLFD